MNIVLFGAPGVGKGTQAELLANKLGLPHISTGAIFRKNISENTPLGLQVREFTDNGKLVPDELTTALALDAITVQNCPNGFILDGYPRNLAQARALHSSLTSQSRQIDKVICLSVPEEELVNRMLSRGRADDNEEVIRTRFQIYENETAPVLNFYKQILEISEIDGVGELQEIHNRILSAVKA